MILNKIAEIIAKIVVEESIKRFKDLIENHLKEEMAKQTQTKLEHIAKRAAMEAVDSRLNQDVVGKSEEYFKSFIPSGSEKMFEELSDSIPAKIMKDITEKVEEVIIDVIGNKEAHFIDNTKRTQACDKCGK